MSEQERPLPAATDQEPRYEYVYVQEEQARRSGCLRGALIGGLGCLTVLVLLVFVPVLLGLNTLGNVTASLGGLLNPGGGPRAAAVFTTQSVVTSVQPLGQLVSISVQYAKADINVQIAQGPLNSCGFGTSHVAQGTIEAGIDLTGIGPDDVSYDPLSNTYTITLPAPRLTSCRIDYIRQYNRSLTFCAVDWDEARVLGQYIALTDFRDTALEGDVLTRARREAELLIGGFVRNLTGSNVIIEFQESEGPVLPSSCDPASPAGWSYNPETGAWLQRAPSD